MFRFLTGAAMSAAMVIASPAFATATISFAPVQANGATSATFWNTGISASTFTDTYSFTLPAGLVSSTISSIFTSAMSNNINFTSVTLNSVPYNIVSTGQIEFRTLFADPIASGVQTLTVAGTSGGNGSYSGTLSFVPAAVPEPTAWVMMILGMGTVGFAMRRRQLPVRVSYAG